MRDEFDAVIVGSGPNGLTAAAVLACAGRRVLVLEAADTIGGGARTDEWFGPGIRTDVCSAVHPTGYASPAFTDLRLTDHGLNWLVPDVSLAHVAASGTTGIHREPECTATELGADAKRWRTLVEANDPRALVEQILAMPTVPRRRLMRTAGFAAAAALPTELLVRAFTTARAATVFAGIAAHAERPLTAPGSSAAGLLLGTLATTGWPVAQGGSHAIVDALASVVRAAGGRIETGCGVTDLGQLPTGCDLLFDTSPDLVARLFADRLGRRYTRALRRFAYGGGTCKVDFVLTDPIPWADRSDLMARTATFHLADDIAQIRRTEADVAAGVLPERPWVLGGEPTRIDPSRAPSGTHLAWAYCHVPADCGVDVSDRIVSEIERVAPGFRDTITGVRVTTATDLQRHNANYVGGDINCGAASLSQLVARPVLSPTPQITGVPGVYLCSSATAPGGGVHGMSGYRAARAVLARG
ncbi:NAD(P)/FAD-dependent oxidoreductase [Gordonia sp. HY002]|uniref:phytoene desaturase family protein n=1 Tax=Gordonia zhenghanii TaxID=2911516 RepID=UPI001EF0E5E5|nr:NAD(P)/FAD-dependent oxidoreductase [Gordonia zhenghanii]MCF8571970.1 NAD(P)/FAD-dependent oxidoreductase [Gordonia zhenghanii]MCF8604188.1 NAD(P)/FAD-dependent oxidoreductase [Gordonia zhenghanii]